MAQAVVALAVERQPVVVRRPSWSAFRPVFSVGQRSAIGPVSLCDQDFVALTRAIGGECDLRAVVGKGCVLLVEGRRQKLLRLLSFFELEQINVETATH